ncbi:Tumor susceptibility gene 101 protein [Entamoeba marina]
MQCLHSSFQRIQMLYMFYDRVLAESNIIIRRFSFTMAILPHPISRVDQITLLGTMGINYLNNQYQIPLMIMFPYNFPFGAPQFFTDPSPQMKIVPFHPFAKPDRSIHHPILSNWDSNLSILNVYFQLQKDFSEFPPLLNKSHFLGNNPIPIGISQHLREIIRDIFDKLLLQGTLTVEEYKNLYVNFARSSGD